MYDANAVIPSEVLRIECQETSNPMREQERRNPRVVGLLPSTFLQRD